jgi:hypothetical protein
MQDKPNVSKRASKTKEPPQPVRDIQIPSYSQDVQLQKADNAWTPQSIAKKKKELDNFLKKVRFNKKFMDWVLGNLLKTKKNLSVF